MKNYITIKNFLNKEECDNLLEFSLKKDLKVANVAIPDGVDAKKIRNSNVFFYDYSVDFSYLNPKLIEIFKKEVKIKGYDIDFTKNNFQFTEYGVGGFYTWHTDSSPDTYTDRYCSMVIQLNDDYEGGDLQMRNEDKEEITLERGLGNLFLFYSHIWHTVTPVTNGCRYSLVNWFKITPQQNYKKTLV